MKSVCSIVPYRKDKDGNLKKSIVFENIQKIDINSIKSNIQDLMNFGIIPTIEDYIKIRPDYKDTNEDTIMKRILGTFLYSESISRNPSDEGELSIESTIAGLSTDNLYNEQEKEAFKQLGEALGLDIEHAYNPIINSDTSFSKNDYTNIARILQGIYLEVKDLSKEEYIKRFGTKYNINTKSGFKAIILEQLRQKLLNIMGNSETIRTKYNDDSVRMLLTELYDPNSKAFEFYLDYIKYNLGVDRKYDSKTQIDIRTNTEDDQRDPVGDIAIQWDELQREQIDRKNTLSSHVKSEIAKLLGKYSFSKSRANKWYIPIPTDINSLWNSLIQAHLYDITTEDFYNRIKQLSAEQDEFKIIADIFNRVFENDGTAASESDLAFVNGYISGIKLAVIPSNILLLDGSNANYITNNKNAFAETIYKDRFSSVISSNIEYGLYNNKISIFKPNDNSRQTIKFIKSESEAIEDLIKQQMSVINALGLDITRKALNQYYNSSNNKVKAYNYVSNLLNKVVNDVINRSNNDFQLSSDVNGYLTKLAKIATYDFENVSRLSYLDVNGKLNYSPQYDSMLTKFLRGFVTRTGVNTEYIKYIFKDYLNDPTLTAEGCENNLLVYDEKTGLGIFTKNTNGEWDIHPDFIKDIEHKKQFAISSFNGLKINGKGYKYRELQGDLYAYTEILLGTLGQYVFLTSDSPRSYTMTIKSIPMNDLFIPYNSEIKEDFVQSYPKEAISIKNIKDHPNELFVIFEDQATRILDKDGFNKLSNVISIDKYKGDNVINGKSTEQISFTEEDYDNFVKDFEKRVKPKIDTALESGKIIKVSTDTYELKKILPDNIFKYIETYFNKIYNLRDVTLTTNQKINTESKVFRALVKIVKSDLNKFNLFGKYVFSLRDNSEENLNIMKTRHNVKYWNGKTIYNNDGTPTGRAFQFLNITYSENGKSVNLIQYIANQNNISVAEIYKNMYAKLRGESYVEDYTPNEAYITNFVKKYVRWNATEQVDRVKPIINNLLDSTITVDGENQYIYHKYIQPYIEDVYKDLIAKKVEYFNKNYSIDYQGNKIIYTEETLPNNVKINVRENATEFIINQFKEKPLEQSAIRLSILQVLLNNTIYNESVNAIFNGDLEEYKNTVDLNKRVAQVIKNGLNSVDSINEDSSLKIAVVEDMNFPSNILSSMNGVSDDIKSKYAKPATINDSQSIMTDVAFIKLLKATGRWSEDNPVYTYVQNLRGYYKDENGNWIYDSTRPFDASAYSRIAEQVKVFGTARRRRGEFYHNPAVEEGEYDIFANEIDSYQIKDSTIILFEATTRGTAMGQLYDAMRKQDIDQITPKSAVKVSGMTPTKIHKDDGSLDINVVNNITDKSILYANSSDFVVQQDIKSDILDGEAILGIQLLKHTVEGLNWDEATYNLDDKKITGKEIFKEFQALLSANIKEDAFNLLVDLGAIDSDGSLVTDNKANIKINITKFVKELQKIVGNNIDSEILQDALELDADGNPKMPLSYPAIKNKIERSIASLFTKRVINQNLPGFHVPLRADIFTADNRLIKHGQLYENKEEYNKIIDELVKNGSITYSTDFINRCKETGRSLELQAEYIDGDNFYYAEVLISPWQKDFYTNIGITKTIKLSNGTTREIKTIDIDKIDIEARRSLASRIPGEGKQSTVLFEVVGIINTGASQAILPQSLVTRTGWDFDIDKIFAYMPSLIFQQGKYTSIKFKSKFDPSEAQVGHSFARSIFRNKYQELLTTPQDFDNLASKKFINTAKLIKLACNIDFNPNSDNQGLLVNITRLLDADSQIVDDNNPYAQLSKELSYKFKTKFRKLYNDLINNIVEYIRNIDTQTESISDSQQNYISKLLRDSYSDIKSIIEFIKYTKEQLDTIDFTDLKDTNFRSIINKLDSTIKFIDDKIESNLTSIQSAIDSKFNDFTKQFTKNQTIYEQNSREARNNRILDIFKSILSNPYHRNEIDKPNETTELVEVSDYINSLWNSSLNGLNPNNMFDKILLNNMSMGSTILKGHSVNMDTALAVLSTVHAKFKHGVRQVLNVEELPIPKGFKDRTEMYYQNSNGSYILTNRYKTFLEDILGKQSVEFINDKTGILSLIDRYILNNSKNTHLDISGERTELQANQYTSAILDILKSGLGFNVNTYTLSVLRLLSCGSVIGTFNNKNNRFLYGNLIVHQPIIVEAVKQMELNVLNGINSTIEDVLNKLIEDYSNIADYDDISNTPLDSQTLIDCIKNRGELTTYGYTKNDRDWYITQISVAQEFINWKSLADEIISLQFLLKTDKGVRSFYNADSYAYRLAEYEYPTEKILKNTGKFYNNTSIFVKKLLSQEKDTNKKDEIRNRFLHNKTSDFIKIYKNKIEDTTGKLLTYNDYIEFKRDFTKSVTVSDRKALLEKYNIPFKNNKNLVLADGKDILDAIFPGLKTNYLTTDNSGNIIFDNSESKSIYPIIEARYKYAYWIMSNGFSDVFISRNNEFKNEVFGTLVSNRGRLDENTYNWVYDNLINELISKYGNGSTVLPILTPVNAEEIQITLGIASDELKREQNQIVKSLIGTIKDGFTTDKFKQYTKLSLAQQLTVIKSDPTLRDYIYKSPQFRNCNILKYLQAISNSNKPYDIIRVSIDDNDVNTNFALTDSIRKMWDSQIPYIAHTIRQLIMYTYVTNGFGYAFNIARYIPIELISEEHHNEQYDKLCAEIKYVDPSENIGHYRNHLIQLENLFINLYDSTELEVSQLIGSLSRIRSDINPLIQSANTKANLWQKNKSVATMGWALNKARKNVAEFTITDSAGYTQYGFFETEFRLNNSKYANSEYVTLKTNDKNIVFKRYPLSINSKDARKNLFVYLQVNPILKNEFSLISRENSIIPQYQSEDMFEIKLEDGTSEYVDRVTYINSLNKQDQFIKVISDNDEFEVQSDNTNDINDDNTQNNDLVENNTDEESENDVASIDEIAKSKIGKLGAGFSEEYIIDNTKDVFDSLTNTIDKIKKENDTFIYITTAKSKNTYKNLHGSDVVYVDYEKSPVEEAERLASAFAGKRVYINGDLFEDIKTKSRSDIRNWVKNFINNLYNLTNNIEEVNTIINKGIGEIIGKTYIDAKRTNYNIYGTKVQLESKIISIDSSTDDNFTQALQTDSNIALNMMKRLSQINRFFNTTYYLKADVLKSIFESFNNVEYEGGIDQALQDLNEDAINFTLSNLKDYSNIIYKTVTDIINIIKSQRYADIRENYGASVDYKDQLLTALRLIKSVNEFNKLQPINIEDTIYKNKSDEDINNFEQNYGELNANINQIKYNIDKIQTYEPLLIELAKDIIAFKIIDESRNPKYTTAFSKFKEYLKTHDLNLDDYTNLYDVINVDDLNKIKSIVFNSATDITFLQKTLDSAFTTGVSLIDIVGKSWDTANYKAKRKAQIINDKLEEALESYKKGLWKNSKAREALMHKFINEFGDFISTQDLEGLGSSITILKELLFNTINENLYTSENVITNETAFKTRQKLQELIDEFNNKYTWNIKPLDDETQAKHLELMESMGVRERNIYIKTHRLVDLKLVTDDYGKIESKLYQIDISNVPETEAFSQLTNEEKELLNKIKSIIQEAIQEWNPNFVYYYGDWDSIVPYLPNATLGQALKGFISIPSVKRERTFTQIDGSKQYIIKSNMLELPQFIPNYRIPKRRTSENQNEYYNRVINDFSNWFDKNNKLTNYVKPKTYNDIWDYIKEVTKENKRRKAKSMSYDIVDITKALTQELYNNIAINNFQIDYDIAKYLFDWKENGISMRDKLVRAREQFDNMLKRIVNANKYDSKAQIAASSLSRYTSVAFMYFNYTSGITNVLKGITDMIVESHGDGFVGTKNVIRDGINQIIKSVPKFLRDLQSSHTDDLIVAIIKDFEDIYQDTRDVRSSDTASGLWVKIINQFNKYGYSPNNMGEFTMQFGMLLAATKSHRVVKGNIVSFNDFYNDSFDIILKDVLTSEEFEKFKLFKEEFDERIENYQKKYNKEYLWNYDYAAQYIKEHGIELSKEKRNEIVKLIKENKNKYRKEFDKYPTLYECLELKNGKLSYKENSGLTEAKLSDFRSRVRAINHRLHGIYDRVNRNSLQDSAVGDLFMQFKKWIRPNLNRLWGRRFGRIFYNEQLGGFEVPMFNMMFDMFNSGNRRYKSSIPEDPNFTDYLKGIGNWLKGISNYLTHIKFYYNTMPLNERIAAVQLAKFTGSIVFGCIAAILADLLIGDDDDDDNKLIQHLAYISTQYYSELVSMTPIYGWGTMIKQQHDTLFAGYTIISDFISLNTLLLKSLWSNEDDMIYKRGVYTGKDKRLVKLNRIIPVERQIHKFKNLGSTMSYYKANNPFSIAKDGFYELFNIENDNDNENNNENENE